MKKTYILILEFEAEVLSQDGKQEPNLELLLAEFLKNDRNVLDIYRRRLMSDLGSGNRIYKTNGDIDILKDTDEYEAVKKLIPLLPGEARSYFENIFAKDGDTIDRYFESFFDCFGVLEMKRANFLEKGKPDARGEEGYPETGVSKA